MINFNFKHFLVLIFLLVVSFSLNAKTLKIGARATPSIDPHFGFLTTNIAYNAHIYGFIVGKNENSRKIPDLAVSWKSLNDTTWEFELRKGVKFHDGHEFDAKDVLFTYKSIMDNKNLSPRKSDFEPIKNIQIVNKNKIIIRYKRHYSPAFGTWTIGILPEHLLNKEYLTKESKTRKIDQKNFNLRISKFNRHPIGTGPFKFKEWRSDELIKLEKNKNYWEGPPNYSEFIYRIIPDALTQEMAFYTGTIDSYGAGVHQVNRLKKDKRFQVFSG